MTLTLLANLSFYIPELIAIALMTSLLFLEAAYGKEERSRIMVYSASVIGLVCCGIFLVINLSKPETTLFADAVVIDSFSTLIKLIMVVGTLGSIYLSSQSSDIYQGLKSEFMIMSVGVLIGGMLLASANNMLTLYLGVEILSILSYVMATFKRNDARSSEAGLKYVLYGGVSAGVMLFGMSHMYGLLGTIDFTGIGAKIATLSDSEMVLLGMSSLLFFVGIAYKVAAFPFHMWSPDVYHGSPMPVTNFFSIVPKVAGIAALLRISFAFFQSDDAISTSWFGMLHIIAALTMTVGNVCAVDQSSIKRMLAFSSISHAGMMLLGVVVLNDSGVDAILFYAVTYLFMTTLSFVVAGHVSDQYGSDAILHFKGLVHKHPLMAIVMGSAMLSLAGLPPFSGFVAKFGIFNVIVKKGFYGLALVAAVNSVIALYYYLNVVKVMFLDRPDSEVPVSKFSFVNQLVACAICVPVIGLGIFWDSLMGLVRSGHLFVP